MNPSKNTSFGLIFVLLLLSIFTACENDLEQVNELNPQEFVNKEVTKDVELIYSDSAIVRTIIRAEEMVYHADKANPRQEFTKGIHPISLSLIKSTPARETVAGVAFFRLEISNNSRIEGVKGIRSLETSVKTLLSSITVLRDSIHSGSISPSRIENLLG